ncbi:MAG: hypothetical protein MJ234_06465 [bacterium]|nr:hypothetical protein [bacterium]
MPDIRHSRYRACRLCGVTLMELAIGTAIAIAVSSLSILMFVQTLRGLKEARTLSESDYELAKSYSIIKRQIESIHSPFYESQAPCFRLEKSSDGKSDMLIFYTDSPYSGKGVVTACYFTETDSNGRRSLAYGEFPYPEELSDENAEELKARGMVISDKITGMAAFCINHGQRSLESESEIPEQIALRLFYNEDGKEKYFEFKARPGIKWQ